MKKLAAGLFLFSFFNVKGQSLQPVSTTVPDSITSLYFANQGQSLVIHNGRVFYGYPRMKNHALYPSADWQKASLLYDGTWYHDISLMYDVYMDEVITRHPSNTAVRLFTERVQQFSFGGVTVVRLTPDKDNVVKNALYQRLVDGPVTIFVRRRKEIEEKIVDNVVEWKFISLDQFYVLKDGIYSQISKQKALLDLLKDKKPSLLQHLKRQRLKFKKNKELAIIQIAEFYNQQYK